MSKINNYYQGHTDTQEALKEAQKAPLCSTKDILKVKGNRAFKTKIQEIIKNEN
jgi:hypothetical protein